MMNPALSKLAALYLRFRKLKFLSNERKTLIWEQIEFKIIEMNPKNPTTREI